LLQQVEKLPLEEAFDPEPLPEIWLFDCELIEPENDEDEPELELFF